MRPKKPTPRYTHIADIIELSPHLRRFILSGDGLKDFPVGKEGSYVKLLLAQADGSEMIKRSYTIRSFNPDTNELALDFVVNCHEGPATLWAKQAKVGDNVMIAGPGPLKMTDYQQSSYLLVGDITAVNAVNGYVPRFSKDADVRAVVSVPTRSDIIEMDYDDSHNTVWFVEDEAQTTLEQTVTETAKNMANNTHVFLGIEAGHVRSLKPILQDELGFDRLNIFAVGYWKRGVDADRFGAQKRANPL
ncbi:siderophore-interacting protein [Shewanella youngdeokensis]|uniref:Siderophore-interacting protein n=1 Tax=Shewanella youngdeokensis TaxID=2999068 RepID=A0ABZ0JZ03_9GAMM|nr:siderophore-interacting protein [Shewanella sp. DAU334]